MKVDEAADEARGLHELSVAAAEPELRELTNLGIALDGVR